MSKDSNRTPPPSHTRCPKIPIEHHHHPTPDAQKMSIDLHHLTPDVQKIPIEQYHHPTLDVQKIPMELHHHLIPDVRKKPTRTPSLHMYSKDNIYYRTLNFMSWIPLDHTLMIGIFTSPCS